MCELYIGNLNLDTTERELEEMFARYGQVVRCHIGSSRNKDTPGTNFGFITYTSADCARDAVDRLNGSELNRTRISVQYARRDRDRGGRYDDSRRRRSPRRSPYSRRSPRRSPYGRSRGSPVYENRRRNGASPSDKKCYRCNGYGHIAKFCNSQSGERSSSSRYRRSRSYST